MAQETNEQEVGEVLVEAAPAASSARQLRSAKILLVVFTGLYSTLFAGAAFGWGPMQLLLEADGAFSSKCANQENPDEICPEQTKSLLNVQMVAQLMMVFSPLLGHMCDKRGPSILMNAVASFGFLGVSLIIVASASHVDLLYFVAFPCIGLMATPGAVLIVQAGMVFQSQAVQRRVISVLNALFDAGSITYLGLWTIGDNIQSDDALIFVVGGYLLLAVVCLGGCVIYWRRVATLTAISVSSSDGDPHIETVAPSDPSTFADSLDGSQPSKHASTHTESNPKIVDCSNTEGADTCTTKLYAVDETTPDESSRLESKTKNKAILDTTKEISKDDGAVTAESHYILISLRKPQEQFKSSQFLFLCAYFTFHAARNIFTLTTARDFLAYLGDDETGNRYLSIFTLLMPASVLGLPFVDLILKRYGYHIGLQSINLLAIIHGTIQVSTTNLNVQVVGFLVFSFYRCFLFTVTFSFLPLFLGGEVLGKAAGILVLFAGLSAFLNIPLAAIAVSTFDGNFFWPNLFYTIFVVPFIHTAWRMGKGIQREKQCRRGHVDAD